MKEFIKRWLLVFAMAVISIYVISAVRTGQAARNTLLGGKQLDGRT